MANPGLVRNTTCSAPERAGKWVKNKVGFISTGVPMYIGIGPFVPVCRQVDGRQKDEGNPLILKFKYFFVK
jgi:hypothetical protein